MSQKPRKSNPRRSQSRSSSNPPLEIQANRITFLPETQSQTTPEMTPETTAPDGVTSSGGLDSEPVVSREFDAVAAEASATLGAPPTGEASPENPAPEVERDLIPEILTPERLAAYIDLPFNMTAMALKKPDITLRDEERALLIPIVNKYLPILLRSTGSPEWAAFVMFVLMYGTRLGLSQWLLPMLTGSSETATETAGSQAAPSL